MEKKEQGMACFAIGGATEHDLQLAVDEFFSKCDGFMKVIKGKKRRMDRLLQNKGAGRRSPEGHEHDPGQGHPAINHRRAVALHHARIGLAFLLFRCWPVRFRPRVTHARRGSSNNSKSVKNEGGERTPGGQRMCQCC